MIRKLRLLVRENKFLNHTIYGLIRWIANDIFHYRCKILQRYGYEAVAKINQVAAGTGIQYFAAFGTLLGFIRDHGFIAHDADMDFMLSANDKIKEFYLALEQSGFYFERFILFDGMFKEFTVRYKECSIDFFSMGEKLEDGQKYRVHTENYNEFWGALDLPTPTGYVPYEVHGVRTIIPKNYEDILFANYGEYSKKVVQWSSTMAPAFVKDNGTHHVVVCQDRNKWMIWLNER